VGAPRRPETTVILTLEIVGTNAGKFGADSRKIFKSCGGTLGRSPQCDWTLPDPYISWEHASVKYADERFLITDTSSNGLFVLINEESTPLTEPYVLKNGDHLLLDAYEVRATLLDDDGLGA
jgi:predicted component of type VI protein secretion system